MASLLEQEKQKLDKLVEEKGLSSIETLKQSEDVDRMIASYYIEQMKQQAMQE